MTGPLDGRRVVVTRAADQAGSLGSLLRARGADVIEVPTIEVIDPADDGHALRSAIGRAGPPMRRYDWIVVTSGNGASRVVAAARGIGLGRSDIRASIAVVGPGTAEVFDDNGWSVDLVPSRFVGETLVADFPAGPGTVLVAQAEAARAVVTEGLQAKGWTVDGVVAYRTVPATIDPTLVHRAMNADAITFTSSSTVNNYVRSLGPSAVPKVVVCIGPVTAATAREHGLVVCEVATEHSLSGLVSATIHALGRG